MGAAKTTVMTRTGGMASGLLDVMENTKATRSWWSHGGQSRGTVVVEHGHSATDVAGWTSGYDWGRVDKQIQVLGCRMSHLTNGSVRMAGKPASGMDAYRKHFRKDIRYID